MQARLLGIEEVAWVGGKHREQYITGSLANHALALPLVFHGHEARLLGLGLAAGGNAGPHLDAGGATLQR